MAIPPRELDAKLEHHLITLTSVHTSLSAALEFMDPAIFTDQIHTRYMLKEVEMIHMLCDSIREKATQIKDSLYFSLMYPSPPPPQHPHHRHHPH